MKYLILMALFTLLIVPSVFAVPTLQLYIDGATYDDVTETWVTDATSFDLYVIGKGDLDDVYFSMALGGLGESGDPIGAGVDVDGSSYPTGSWTWGYAPITNMPSVFNGGNNDLPTHGVFPAWYTEFGMGDFTAQGGIGDVNVDSANAHGDPFWLPTEGYISSNHQGWFKSYSISISGGYAVHFDAYTKNSDGTINKFAPFSHDAGGGEVPEPTTMLLFGMGLAGTGIIRRLRK